MGTASSKQLYAQIGCGRFEAMPTKVVMDKLANIPMVPKTKDYRKINRIICVGEHQLAVYILTLKDDTKRNERLKQVWKTILDRDVSNFFFYGIRGNKVWGKKIDGKWKWDKSKQQLLVDKGYVSSVSGPGLHNLTPPEVAIGIGFINICCDIVENNHPYTLVMENDSNLLMTNKWDQILDPKTRKFTHNPTVSQSSSAFKKKLKCVLDKLPPDWDFVRLGACFARGHKLVQKWETACGLNLYRVKFALCTHGFLVSRRAAKKFMQFAFPMFTTIDHQMFLILRHPTLKLNDYDVLPHFLGQDLFVDPGGSTIGYTKLEELVLKGMFAFGLSPQRLMEAILLNKLQRRKLVLEIAVILGNKKKNVYKQTEISSAINRAMARAGRYEAQTQGLSKLQENR
jgi:hypothetical protein